MKRNLHIIAVLAAIAPAIYLLIIFPELPQTVPTHFGLNGKADDWGSKNMLWAITGILTTVSLLVYLLLCNIHKIDTMRTAAENKGQLQKIALIVVLFISVINIWIVGITENENIGGEVRFVFTAVGILLAILGFYMRNLRPNYFAGIRLPWTLENEENWKKTHSYTSNIWLAGGSVITISSLFFQTVVSMIIMFTAVAFMAVLPFVYSYRLYKMQKRSG